MTKDELTALKVDPSLHEDPTLKEIKDIPTALKVLVDTKAFVGKSIRLPSESASPEEREAFVTDITKKIPSLIALPADPAKLAEVEGTIFEKLGRPKDETGYPTVKELIKELPDGVEVDEKELRATAKRLGLTKKGYAELAKAAVEQRTAIVQRNSEQAKALKKELGEAAEERLTAAAAAAKKLGRSDDYVTALKNGAVPAEEAKAWINVAKSLGEEGKGFFTGQESGNGRLTPDEAKAQIAELRRNPALTDSSNPEHGWAVERLYTLNKAAYPEETRED